MNDKTILSELIIVNDAGAKAIIFIIILLLVTIGFIIICISSFYNNADVPVSISFFNKKIITSNPIVASIPYIFFMVLFFIFLRKSIFSPRKIIIDFDFRTVEIHGLSIQVFQKIIPFDEIKSIEFFEKEMEHNSSHGDRWKKSIKITNISNDILFDERVANIINYENLEELCKGLFLIDYRVMYLEETILE
jgi:hypothetical protein